MAVVWLPIAPIDRAGFVARLELTVPAMWSILLATPASLLLIVTVIGVALVPVGVGVVVLLAAIPLTAALTDVHRAISGRVLGEQIPSAYASTDGVNAFGRIWIWLRESARWRDLAFLAYAVTGGQVMSGMVVYLLLAPAIYLVLAVTLGGGGLLLLLALSPLAWALWWLLTPYLVPARAIVERAILGVSRTEELAKRVDSVTASRAETIDHSAAELRRIERDLHDGAQARMVSLGMHLGLAEELIRTDPEAAARLLADARDATVSALDDLRGVVRGIHPPVLADRGLVGAVEALTLQLALPVTLRAEMDGRAPDPVESAAYFAIAECLSNVVKHAQATTAWVRIEHRDGQTQFQVGDDGSGGASEQLGTGLRGVAQRLAAFDGKMVVQSPAGGPTVVTMELPCVLSSRRTSPSSEMG